jgi:putative MATE family efflux protein
MDRGDILTKSLNTKRYEVEMINGNIFKNMIRYCIPLMLTGILQLFYNAADLVIVSNFSNDPNALGAVGSTGSLTALIVNLFMGLSVGTNVLSARSYAIKDKDGMSKIVHTSVLISIIIGVVIGIFGFTSAKWLLDIMSNPLPKAVTYIKIYFIGLPFMLLYNFSAAILRGVGDTKRPLYILSISGLANVLLNLFFVIVCKMGVEGVAIATLASQVISSILIISCLLKTKEIYKLTLKELKISKKELFSMLKIGLPAGIQSSLFSISNVLIQSSINKFGEAVMNGNTAANSLDGFVYTSMNSVYHASIAFTSQNVAAKRKENIRKVLFYALFLVFIVGLTTGGEEMTWTEEGEPNKAPMAVVIKDGVYTAM